MPVDPTSSVEITGFRSVPDFARGFVKDLRVRWACEEAGVTYRERLLSADHVKSSEFRCEQPSGQVPVFRDRELCLFESGAIVTYIAKRTTLLMPANPADSARVLAWIFAAISSVEPFVSSLAEIDLFHRDEDWAKIRRPTVAGNLADRLANLSEALGTNAFLVGGFSAADLLMASVLQDVSDEKLIGRHANLAEYLARCTARPAFARALDAQITSLE